MEMPGTRVDVVPTCLTMVTGLAWLVRVCVSISPKRHYRSHQISHKYGNLQGTLQPKLQTFPKLSKDTFQEAFTETHKGSPSGTKLETCPSVSAEALSP